MKRSPLYHRSGVGRPSKGSPIQLWGFAAKRILKPVAKHLAKNWKKYVAGEVAWQAGEYAYDKHKESKSKEEEEGIQIKPGDKIRAINIDD